MQCAQVYRIFPSQFRLLLCLMAWHDFAYHDLHVTAFFSRTLQVQRIEEYHKLLVRLFQLTSEDHPDHYDLRYTITCVESVRTLLTLNMSNK